MTVSHELSADLGRRLADDDDGALLELIARRALAVHSYGATVGLTGAELTEFVIEVLGTAWGAEDVDGQLLASARRSADRRGGRGTTGAALAVERFRHSRGAAPPADVLADVLHRLSSRARAANGETLRDPAAPTVRLVHASPDPADEDSRTWVPRAASAETSAVASVPEQVAQPWVPSRMQGRGPETRRAEVAGEATVGGAWVPPALALRRQRTGALAAPEQRSAATWTVPSRNPPQDNAAMARRRRRSVVRRGGKGAFVAAGAVSLLVTGLVVLTATGTVAIDRDDAETGPVSAKRDATPPPATPLAPTHRGGGEKSVTTTSREAASRNAAQRRARRISEARRERRRRAAGLAQRRAAARARAGGGGAAIAPNPTVPARRSPAPATRATPAPRSQTRARAPSAERPSFEPEATPSNPAPPTSDVPGRTP